MVSDDVGTHTNKLDARVWEGRLQYLATASTASLVRICNPEISRVGESFNYIFAETTMAKVEQGVGLEGTR